MLSITNYQSLVRPMQWLVVALVFLFFLRIARAVIVEARPVGGIGSGSRRRGARLKALEGRGLAEETFSLAKDATIGRASTCDVSIPADSFASTVHARIAFDEDGLYIEDLGSTNGTYVNAERVAGRTSLRRGDTVQVGESVFEVTR
ncbi:MAG: FHA domain-containing protein [Actinobacteria bacterium]|nr:FHA domain-containing protein [Actinomycetota bacterium]